MKTRAKPTKKGRYKPFNYTVHVSTIYLILKQGYLLRLEVSHLQALTTFSFPHALPNLGSHSVYNCGIHFS